MNDRMIKLQVKPLSFLSKRDKFKVNEKNTHVKQWKRQSCNGIGCGEIKRRKEAREEKKKKEKETSKKWQGKLMSQLPIQEMKEEAGQKEGGGEKKMKKRVSSSRSSKE